MLCGGLENLLKTKILQSQKRRLLRILKQLIESQNPNPFGTGQSFISLLLP